MKDKGLFFLTLSFGCIWLVLDQIFGNKLIEQFVGNLLPSAKKDSSGVKGTINSAVEQGEKEGSAGDKEEYDSNGVKQTYHYTSEGIKHAGKLEDCTICKTTGGGLVN